MGKCGLNEYVSLPKIEKFMNLTFELAKSWENLPGNEKFQQKFFSSVNYQIYTTMKKPDVFYGKMQNGIARAIDGK